MISAEREAGFTVATHQEQEQHLNHYTPTRFLTIPEFLDRKGGSRSRLYEMMNPDHTRFDPDLPVPIKVGRLTFFVEEEVEAYLRLTIEQSRARDAAIAAPKRSRATKKKGPSPPTLHI